VLGLVLGGVLIVLGALCRFNTEALLHRSPGRKKDPNYDEVKVQRYLRRSGLFYMALGAALFVLGAAKV
jgi:hypothetical protein